MIKDRIHSSRRAKAVVEIVKSDAGQAERAIPAMPRAATLDSIFKSRGARIAAARRLNMGAVILALSVFADSAVEHYRGSFRNRAMYVPLIVSSLTLAAGLAASAEKRPHARLWRDAVYGAAAAAGVAGLGFHAYNILKRPGGLSWLNLFCAAPAGAPAALALAGLLGRGAERASDGAVDRSVGFLGLPLGRMLALVSAVGLAGATGEAGLLHYRGSFQNPAMILPLSAPPVASALLGAAVVQPHGRHWMARWWLRLTAFLGFAGAGFHAYGISRSMGGWRNWSQNLLAGPPLPAPPSFTGLALAGLAALALIESDADD
jgi:hypothetical protein